MTTGQLAIITEDKKVVSTRMYYGSMYPESFGAEALRLLASVKNEADYETAVYELKKIRQKAKFEDSDFLKDGTNFIALTKEKDIDDVLNMSEGLRSKWYGMYADYVIFLNNYIYLKNISTNNVTWIDCDGVVRNIAPNAAIAIDFGAYTGITADNIDSYLLLKQKYAAELNDRDICALLDNNIANRVRGIYDDEYDIGYEYAMNVWGGVPSWLVDDRYVNFDNIGADILRDKGSEAWFDLPSGKYAHLE